MSSPLHAFARPPFDPVAKPSDVYLSASARDTILCLKGVIDAPEGHAALVGEAGVGKTTLLKKLAADLKDGFCRIIYVQRPHAGPFGVRYLMDQLAGRDSGNAGDTDLTAAVKALLATDGSKAVLIIDDAHELHAKAVEYLAIVAKLHTSRGHAVKIIFSGRPAFWSLFSAESIASLRDGITMRLVMPPLSEPDACAYIAHRIRCAGGSVRRVMSRTALKHIVARGAGVPAEIDALCTTALTEVAYLRGRRLTKRICQRTLSSPTEQIPQLRRKRQFLVLAGAAAAACIAVFVPITYSHFMPDVVRAIHAVPQTASFLSASMRIPTSPNLQHQNEASAITPVSPEPERSGQLSSLETEAATAVPKTLVAAAAVPNSEPLAFGPVPTQLVETGEERASRKKLQPALASPTHLATASLLDSEPLAGSAAPAPSETRREPISLKTLEPAHAALTQVAAAQLPAPHPSLETAGDSASLKTEQPAPTLVNDLSAATQPRSEPLVASAVSAQSKTADEPVSLKAVKPGMTPVVQLTAAALPQPNPPQTEPPRADAAQHTTEPNSIAPGTRNALLARGSELLALGDLSGARHFYQLAAAEGSAEAAAAVGRTYDPLFLAQAGARGVQADFAKAIEWYSRATAAGDAQAEKRLQELQHPVSN
ncbi:MAG: AAA family ATPase [Acetobacteraceae bacterium]|nr:AAA family ATPase [Acetobacteraceae bacterium]